MVVVVLEVIGAVGVGSSGVGVDFGDNCGMIPPRHLEQKWGELFKAGKSTLDCTVHASTSFVELVERFP